jgi:hypothetical protein
MRLLEPLSGPTGSGMSPIFMLILLRTRMLLISFLEAGSNQALLWIIPIPDLLLLSLSCGD